MMAPSISTAAPTLPSEAGIVVIGRNEGDRLLVCLKSLQSQSRPVVYVDSGSADSSVDRARPLCQQVVELDPARSFSAARARNEGVEALVARNPGVRYVQFLDGDCAMQPTWLDSAQAALVAEPQCAVVVGHLQEFRPEASVYNHMCALEWKSAPGVIENYGALGGIMMIRLTVFQQLGGFNTDVIAGEDSELGVRIGMSGFSVRKLDVPMAIHDANILRFGQWWTRSVRAGHAIGQRSHLNGTSDLQDCVRERRSTWLWGVFLPLFVALALVPTRGLSLLLLSGYAVLGWRIVRYRLGRGDSANDSWLYARFTVLGRLANGIGLIKFYVNRFLGRFHIIEYK